MSTTKPELTTTSYAILGLLAIKPWTPYELAQQMGRAINRFWPRTRSKLYEEPKKLVSHGLAKASVGAQGRRPRTTYTITPKGRRAMAAWMSTPGEGPALEFEALLKVFFAENGSKADLLAAIDSARGWAADGLADGREIVRGYQEGEGPFPERLPQLMLVGEFLNQFTLLVDDWAQWAAGVVASWPDDVAAAKPDLAILERMAARQRR